MTQSLALHSCLAGLLVEQVAVGVIEVGVVVELSTKPRASKIRKILGKKLFGKHKAIV